MSEQRYLANGSHPSLNSPMVVGTLFIRRDKLCFLTEAAQVELPLHGLQISFGGFNNTQIFFTHPLQSGWSIYTSDNEILQEPALKHDPMLKQLIARRKRGPGKAILFLVVFFGLLVLALLGLVTQKSRIAKYIASQIPVSWEQSLGDKLYEQIKGDGKLVLNPEIEPAFAALTAPLVKSVEGSRYQFKFHAIQDTNINAFAIPGGHIFLNTGLIALAEKPEEILGVLAHEMAHIEQRHSLRQLIESAGLYFIVQYFLGDATGLLAAIVDSSELLLRQKFSRDFEREADETGFGYLRASRINPAGLLTIFERFKKLEEDRKNTGLPALELLNTHPPAKERLDRLRELIKSSADQEYLAMTGEFKTLKALVSSQ